TLKISVRIDRKLTTKCWVGFIDWLDELPLLLIVKHDKNQPHWPKQYLDDDTNRMKLANGEIMEQDIADVVFFVPQHTTCWRLSPTRTREGYEADNHETDNHIKACAKLPRIGQNLRPRCRDRAHHLTRKR